MTTKAEQPNEIQTMFEAGAHYGYSKSRRHPSTIPFIYGSKNGVELFDLEKTNVELERAKAFAKSLAESGKKLLFVSSKHEAKRAVENGAESINQPYMTGRWIGGTLTNFGQIKKRIARLHELRTQKEKGELAKYTKKERLLIDREIKTLEEKFGGVADMEGLPGALFIVDLREEETALREGQRKGLPIIALCNVDCNLIEAEYPIPGNDASRKSIEFFVNEIVKAYQSGQK